MEHLFVGPKGQPFQDCMMESEKETPTKYIGSFDWDTKNFDGNWLKQLSHPTHHHKYVSFRLVGPLLDIW